MDEYTPGTLQTDWTAQIGSKMGGTYKEYRSYSKDATTGVSVDEELQVWSFNHSYATQYRDVTASGGSAQHQAWSFGGTKTPAAAMTLKGSGTYVGKFGATAKTSNYTDSGLATQTVSNNNIWMVQGDSNLSADFVAGTFTGSLSPNIWVGAATLNSGTGFEFILASDTGNANYAPFMSDKVNLRGTISSSATTGNSIVGTASMDATRGWITNSTTNAMYAGVFGANAEEITGAFAVDATTPFPRGGYIPINDDRRGYITMSGVFNGQ